MATIYKRGKVWWLAYSVNGKRVQRSIGPYKKFAEVAKKDVEVKLAKDRAGLAPTRKVKIDDYLTEYHNYVDVHNKPRTAQRWKEIVRFFVEWLRTQPETYTYLDDVTFAALENYKMHRVKFVKPITANKDITTLHTFFNRAVKLGYLRKNPAKGVVKIRVTKPKIPRFLSKEELKKILEESNDRLRDILIVLANTGMRYGELQNLEWNDVDLNGRVIHLRIKDDWSPKSGKERKIPINDKVFGVISQQARKSNLVFSSRSGKKIRHTREELQRICKKLDIRNINLHSLRHTFASHLVMSGVDIATVQKLLGHQDIRTTMIYSHLSQDHLRQAVDKLEL